MTKNASKTLEERVEELLNEDPEERHARTMRLLAERIAYHELKAESESARSSEPSSTE
jgi:hypothetical protein